MPRDNNSMVRGPNLWAKLLDYHLVRTGLSEYDIAPRVGVSQPMVNHWRTGREAPPSLKSEERVIKIGEALRLDDHQMKEFIAAARMSSLPSWACEIIDGLKKRIAELENKLSPKA